jgi:hypothetical protein
VKQSRTKTAARRFDFPTQVGSRQAMAAGDGGDGKNPLCSQRGGGKGRGRGGGAARMRGKVNRVCCCLWVD